MISSDPKSIEASLPRRMDWRGWLALGWAVWFGALYVRMVLIARAPGLASWLGQSGNP